MDAGGEQCGREGRINGVFFFLQRKTRHPGDLEVCRGGRLHVISLVVVVRRKGVVVGE